MPRRAATQPRPPAFPIVEDYLERVLPGSSARIQRYRHELLDFACTPTERAIFLTLVGSGRMEVGRLVALLRTAMMMQPVAATRLLEAARVSPGGLADYRQLAGAFAELDASAMREASVLGELLGHAVLEVSQPGVFERAVLLDGRRTAIVELTGGFVHVIEPANLTEPAQSTLAAICAGAPFQRVGESEEGEGLLSFEGVTICTTWRRSAAEGLRPDVARRLVGREIAVPRLSELQADFPVQVELALERLRREYERFVARAVHSTDAARDYWLAARPPRRLPPAARATLAGVDWSCHGEDEGLLQAVRAIVAGTRPEEAVAGLAIAEPSRRSDPIDHMLRRLEALEGHDGKGLAGRIRILELEVRADLKARLRTDAAAAGRLARRLGISPELLASQLAQIDRVRTNAPESNT